MSIITFPAQSGIAVDRSDMKPMGAAYQKITHPGDASFSTLVNVQGSGFLEHFTFSSLSQGGGKLRVTLDGVVIFDMLLGASGPKTAYITKREYRTLVNGGYTQLFGVDGFGMASGNPSNWNYYMYAGTPIIMANSANLAQLIELPDSLYFKKSLLIQCGVYAIGYGSGDMYYTYAGGYKS